jgi:hypothetical protein
MVIAKHLTLGDTGVVKLLCAATIANKVPGIDPVWIFVIGSSSGGKSSLLQALSYASTMVRVDDLTSKTFISGAKAGAVETSLLFRLPKPVATLVISDLTVLLGKDEREAREIFSQLRMIYDGEFTKMFGTGAVVPAKVHVGLVAGVTSVIEDSQGDEAAVGQRAVMYHMAQPKDGDIRDIGARMLMGEADAAGAREEMGAAFRDFIDLNDWHLEELPSIARDVAYDIMDVGNMASLSRSSVKRDPFDREHNIVRANLREMPFRVAKQLANVARGFMAMEGGKLLPADMATVFRLGLDSIPTARRNVMKSCTMWEEVTLEGLAEELHLPKPSVKIPLDDLVALGVVLVSRGFSSKLSYRLRQDFRDTITKFEHVAQGTGTLDAVEDSGEGPPPMDWSREEEPGEQQRTLT